MTKPGMSDQDMAARVAMELPDGSYVNLGIGMPMLVSTHIPPGRTVIFQAENGVLGVGPHATAENGDPDLGNAGDEDITVIPGASFFDSSTAFAMINGGHLDATVLGAFQVSKSGDLANWKLPTRKVGSYGGAMDLATGARRVIAMMKHVTKDNEARVVDVCSYPLTAKGCVKTIVTDLAVIDVTPAGLVLREVAKGWTAAEVQALTGPKLDTANTKEWGAAI